MFLLSLLVACAPHHIVQVDAGTPVRLRGPDDGTPLADGTLPRPFTALQLHDAFPAGTRIRFLVDQPGQPQIEERSTFLDCTAESTTVATEDRVAGADAPEVGHTTYTWTELMNHAAFPAAATHRFSGVITVPVGRFDAWVYEVTAPGDDGVPELSRYWFAKTMPGPPVLYTVEREGKETLRLQLVERAAPEG